MYAMDYMTQGIYTLAAFSEMLDVFDYIGSFLHVNSSSKTFNTDELSEEDILNNETSQPSTNDNPVVEEVQLQHIVEDRSEEILNKTLNSTPNSEKTFPTSPQLDKLTSKNVQSSNFESSPKENGENLTETHQTIKSEEDFEQLTRADDLSCIDRKNYNGKPRTPDLDETEQIVTEKNNHPEDFKENFNQYEVLTETCEFVPNQHSSKLSNKSNDSQSNLSSNELKINKLRTSKSVGNCLKNGHHEEVESSVHSNEAQIELKSNGFVKKIDSNDCLELKKKFVTSSWDLVSIVKLLYDIPEPKPPQTPSDERMLQVKVLLLSRGAFSQYPQGVYDVIIEDNSLTVLQDDERVLSFPLTHADTSLEPEDVLRIDNKMGRTLYLKCSSKAECLQIMESLATISYNCRQQECINLVHYPLKCYQNIVVIDLGSCSTRAGILMDEPTLPTLFFPSVCATDKTTGKNEYGIEALQTSKRQTSTISFPIRPSVQIIKHNIDVEKVTGIFKKIFQQLRIDPQNYTAQVCLPRSLSISAQNALVQVLLEDLKVRSVSLAHQAILTMYAHNVSTGVVVDIGDRMDIMTVIDGFIVESGVTRLPYGGQRLIHHMKHALAQKHISLSNEIDSFVVQYITENISYIALDYEKEQEIARHHPEAVRKSVDLQPFAKDESCLQCATLEEARFKVPEGLFDPDLWGLDFPGIQKLVQKAIIAAGVDTKKKVAENIYLSGGVTLIPGFVDRLRKEVEKLNGPRIPTKIFASDYRYHSTFIGACRFARMDVFKQVCVTKEEFRKNQQAALKKFALCI